MPLNSKQLWQERSRLAEEQHKAADSGDQNKALIIEGQIQQLDLTLEHVIEEEDAARNAPAPRSPRPRHPSPSASSDRATSSEASTVASRTRPPSSPSARPPRSS
ncbi:MAG: hypothetical protein ACLTYW_00140 [Collinsella sp.]